MKTGHLGQVPLKQCESKGLEGEVADGGALLSAMQDVQKDVSRISLSLSSHAEKK